MLVSDERGTRPPEKAMAGRMVLLGGVMLGVLAVVVEWWRGGLWCGHVSLCLCVWFSFCWGGRGGVLLLLRLGEGGEVSLCCEIPGWGMSKRLLARGEVSLLLLLLLDSLMGDA